MKKQFAYLFCTALLLLLSVPVFANNEVAAPQSNCPNNLSLMPAAIEVDFSPNAIVGAVDNAPVDAAVLAQFQTFMLNYLVSGAPVNALLDSDLDIMTSGAHAILGANYFCRSEGFLIGVFREAQMEGMQGYILEKIVIPELALTDEILAMFIFEPNNQLEFAPEENEDLGVLPPQEGLTLNYQAPDINEAPQVLVPDITPVLRNFRYEFWREYKLVSVDAADTVLAPEAAPQKLCGDYTAFSSLAVGMQAEMYSYYYNQMPISGNLTDDAMNNWLDLTEPDFTPEDEYSFNFFLNAQQTPIYSNPIVDLNSTVIEADAATIWEEPVYQTPVVTILDGPVCRAYELRDYNASCSYSLFFGEVCEAEPVVYELYATWWKIEVTVHGQTYVGWYPENLRQYSWWLWEEGGIFDRVVTAYLLTPIAMQAMAGNSCETLPASRYVAGMEVQANSAMNLRNQPNGDVVGRIEAGQAMILFGEPECEGGFRWWQVAGGWIAENDANNYFISPYQPPAEPTVTTEPPVYVEPPILLPPATAQPQPTRNPRGNGGSSTCDPTTGRGC